MRPVGTDEIWEEEAQLVFKAIGYRGIPIAGVPFDDAWGTIPNDEGRVTDVRGGSICIGQYVVGWAKRGPSGLIGTNGPDSKATVRKLLEDVVEGRVPTGSPVDDTGAWLQSKGVEATSFADWRILDAEEKSRGEAAGRVRTKFTDVAEMLSVIRGTS